MAKEKGELKALERTPEDLLRALKSKRGASVPIFKRVYGPHAMSILHAFVLVLRDEPPTPKKKPPAAADSGKKRRKQKAPAPRFVENPETPLPTKEQFRVLLNEKYTRCATELIQSAYSDIEDLANEAREIVDNLEAGNLGHTERCQVLTETASTLEDIQSVDLPTELEEVSVVRLPSTSKSTSRAHRLHEALYDLTVACDAIEAWMEARTEIDPLPESEEEENEQADIKENIEIALSEIRDHIRDAEGAEFPGMYG